MKARRGYTLAEMIVVVVVVGTIAALAVPRLPFGLIRRRRAEVTAWKIVTDLRRKRSLAISQAASNPDGFALNITRTATTATYEIVHCGDNSVVDSQTIDSSVDVSGKMEFEFGLLGALKEESDSSLDVTAAEKTFTINVIPATGMVKCVEH